MPKDVLLTTLAPYNYRDIQLALYYLKAYCDRHRPAALPKTPIHVEVFPARVSITEATEGILRKNPALVGFSCYVWNVAKILQIGRRIKRKNPDVKIILGGPEVSARSQEVLRKENSIDVVVRGEGEETFYELLQSIVHQYAPLSSIRGITYRSGSGAIHMNPPRPPIKNLDLIPSPYLEGSIGRKADIAFPTETMRGCPYRCHYCYYHKEFSKLRFFSLDRVKRELRYILSQNPPEVYLMDPTFNINRKRAKDILRIFKKYNRNSKLHVELRAELLDAEMITLLRQAHATFIEIGLQSTDFDTLRLANRTLEKNMFKKYLMRLNKEKVPYQLQIIDALPGHTYAKIRKALDWLFMLKPPQVVIMKLMVLPGTFLRRHADNLGLQYDKRPPYFVRKNKTLTRSDLKKIDALRRAIAVLYDTGLLRESLSVITKELKIGFFDIFEAWSQWGPRLGAAIKRERLQSATAITAVPLFVKYLCLRYNKIRAYRDIYPAIRKDLAAYCVTELKRIMKEHDANRHATEKQRDR